MYELARRYEPDLYYVDGDWSGSSSLLGTKPFLAWLFNNYTKRADVVVNDRWGNETRTKHGGYYLCEYDPACKFDSKPFAVTLGFGASFGYSRNEEAHPEVYLNGASLTALFVRTIAKGGNLELNVGPTGDGRIPSSMQTPLRAIGRWLKVNGDAVYGTVGFPWLAGTPECEQVAAGQGQGQGQTHTRCYTWRRTGTSQYSTVYAMYLEWPTAGQPPSNATLSFCVGAIDGPPTVVTLLGREDLGPLRTETGPSGDLVVHLPAIAPGDIPCPDVGVFTFKMTYVTPLLGATCEPRASTVAPAAATTTTATIAATAATATSSTTTTEAVGTHTDTDTVTDISQPSSVASCRWNTSSVTAVHGNVTCEPSTLSGTGGGDVSLSITMPPPHAGTPSIHSIDTRTVVYREDEPAEAERFKVASITMGLGDGAQTPSPTNTYAQARLALALSHLAKAASAGAILAVLPEEFAGSGGPLEGGAGEAFPGDFITLALGAAAKKHNM